MFFSIGHMIRTGVWIVKGSFNMDGQDGWDGLG